MSGVCQPQAPKTFRMFCRDIPIDWIPKNTSDVTQVYQENGVSIGIGLNRSLSPDGLVKVRHYVETNDPLFFGLLAVAYSFSSEAFAPYVWPLRVEDDDCVSKILTTGSLSTIAWRASRAKVYGTAVVNAAIGLETACDTIWTQNEFNMVCTTLRDRLLAAVSDKNAYRELLDTFFVAD